MRAVIDDGVREVRVRLEDEVLRKLFRSKKSTSLSRPGASWYLIIERGRV